MTTNNDNGHFGGPVGHKNPPKAGQFKPGQSGNPRGRPKQQRSNIVAEFDNVFLQKKRVKVDGKYGSYSAVELCFILLKQQMLQDPTPKNMKAFFDLIKALKIQERF